MSNLKETVTFDHKIVLGFSDLTDELQNKIYSKLSEQDFFNTTFEVINITNFSIKEMMVSGINIICKIIVTAECNNPTIGKIITVDMFETRKNSIIYSSGRIQIIAKLPNNDRETKYNIRIDAVKIVAKNILCVGTIIN